MTFRKWWLSAFALLGAAGAVVAFVTGAIEHFNDSFFGAVIISSFVYFFWLLGWHSAIRLDRDGVIVDNLLVGHMIPRGGTVGNRGR